MTKPERRKIEPAPDAYPEIDFERVREITREALDRYEQGLPLTPTQQQIVAYHPQGTAAGCASCGR